MAARMKLTEIRRAATGRPAETIENEEEPVIAVALGALTNFSDLLAARPALKKRSANSRPCCANSRKPRKAETDGNI